MRLNIGSGYMSPDKVFAGNDWVNIDFAYEPGKEEWKNGTYMKFDLTKAWPLQYNSIDCIFASHIFEHFEYKDLYSVLEQCHRVLKVGHPIRIICPDPRVFITNWKLLNKQFLLDCFGKENCQKFEYDKFPNIGFSDMFFGDHYTHAVCPAIEILIIMMIRIRFTIIEELRCGNTMFPEYFKERKDVQSVDLQSFDNRPIMSYYLEAVK